MPLNNEIFNILKKPFGKLISDSKIDSKKIKYLIKISPFTATVGDATTSKVLSFGVIPDLCVVDGKERRLEVPRNFSFATDEPRLGIETIRELKCSNPPGSISKNAFGILKTAIEENQFPARIIVEGEEDLLALPIFMLAPNDALVMYGQPLEGLVIVKINETIRSKAKSLMERIGLD
jgi:uncharacterized protein (UPF0218 family)